MLITTGHALSLVELAKAVDQLEAKAALAEEHGLRHTAKSWRDRAASLAGAPNFRIDEKRFTCFRE
jgi:hypothetical protein